LLRDAGGAAALRMPELLDLRGERAGPALPEAVIQDAGDPTGRGEQDAPPFDSRVPPRDLWIEQVMVFDEQQAVDDKRRDRGEILVDRFGIARVVKRVLVAIV